MVSVWWFVYCFSVAFGEGRRVNSRQQRKTNKGERRIGLHAIAQTFASKCRERHADVMELCMSNPPARDRALVAQRRMGSVLR
jgi:hypothetical protein